MGKSALGWILPIAAAAIAGPAALGALAGSGAPAATAIGAGSAIGGGSIGQALAAQAAGMGGGLGGASALAPATLAPATGGIMQNASTMGLDFLNKIHPPMGWEAGQFNNPFFSGAVSEATKAGYLGGATPPWWKSLFSGGGGDGKFDAFGAAKLFGGMNNSEQTTEQQPGAIPTPAISRGNQVPAANATRIMAHQYRGAKPIETEMDAINRFEDSEQKISRLAEELGLPREQVIYMLQAQKQRGSSIYNV